MSSISSYGTRTDESTEKAWFKEELSKIAHMDASRDKKVEQLKKRTEQALSDLIVIYKSEGCTPLDAKQKAIHTLNKSYLQLTVKLSKTRRAAASLQKDPTIKEALGKKFIESLFEGVQTKAKAVESKSINAKKGVTFATQVDVRYFDKDKSTKSVKQGERAKEPLQTVLLDRLETRLKKASKAEHQNEVAALFEQAANKASFQDSYLFLAKNLPSSVGKKVAAEIFAEFREEICLTLLKEVSWKLRQAIPDVQNFYAELSNTIESIDKTQEVEAVMEKFLNEVYHLSKTHPLQDVSRQACTIILGSAAKKWGLELGKVKDTKIQKARHEFFDNLEKMLKKGLPKEQHLLIEKTFASLPSTENPIELLSFIVMNLERTPPTKERAILIQKMKNDCVTFFLEELVARLKKTEVSEPVLFSQELRCAVDTVRGTPRFLLLAQKPKALNPQEVFQEFIKLAEQCIANHVPQEEQHQAQNLLREYF